MYTELLLWTGYFLSAISLIFLHRQRTGHALVFLIIAALALFTSATGWYPYLNVWDERFHALVAKNLMQHPLKPTLYDEKVVTMPYDYWVTYHIWLHKQPGFLWQIMLSYFVFGVNEFALRFPSALAYTFLVFGLFRSGKILVNSRVGYYSAFLFVSGLYFAEMVSGYEQLDHHDVMSITYVGLSIWAWLEYRQKPKTIWLILIGVFAGLAVLNKWLVGLVVFLVWGLYNLQAHKLNLKKYGPFLMALFITGLIALPWQILIYTWYPTEAQSASGFFVDHFFSPLEGHTGSFWYHVQLLPRHFGSGAQLLIVPAFYFLGKRLQFSKLYWALVGAVLFIYGFFGLAATKMPAFTVVAAVPILVAFGLLMHEGEQYLRNRFANKPYLNLGLIIVLMVFFIYRFNFVKVYAKHPLDGPEHLCHERLIFNKQLFTSLNLPENAVLFNLKGKHYIEAMFYTPAIAYNFIPSESQLQEALEKGKEVYVFSGEDPFPAYLAAREDVNLLEAIPQVCE